VAVRSSYDEIDETLGKYTRAHVPKRQSIGIVSKSSEDFETFYGAYLRVRGDRFLRFFT